MNDLVKALIEGIISEDESPKKKIIGMFGGGFKPPTSGHLEVVKRALDENPEMDALIILVGSGTRNSISQEESLAIWNIYKKSLPNKVRVMASPDNKPPIGAIYSYAKKNSDKEIYWFIGAREGNEEDFQDIATRTKSLRKGDYSNIKVKEIVTGGSVSGTKARQALLAKDKETFIQFLPNIPEIDEIWDMLTDVVKERISFKPEFDETEVEFIEDFADDKMQPDVDIDLSGQHFFDRLNDPRNYPDIEPYELEDFFEKLSDEKDEFITFLKKYKNVVVKDTETNINIPFMKAANKAIAKTIMRKRNFKTPDAILPLKEGRYDAEVTMISRMVVNVFKDAFGEKFETTFEDAGELNGDTYELETYFYPTPFNKLGPVPFIINAAGDGDGIAIQINYNPDSFPTAYNELIPEIKDAVRHELEHVSQYRNYNKEVKPGGVNQDDLPLYDYLTLDYEIPAFVQGLYKKAKTKKITFTAAVDEFLDERVEELMPEEAAKVKQIYITYAKKNLPAAQLDEKANENITPNHNQKSSPYGSGYKPLKEELTPHIISLTQFMGSHGLNLKPYPKVKFIDNDVENSQNIFGRTAYYDPNQHIVALYTMGRHPKDILRSYAHELIHHHQNLNNTLDHSQTTNTNGDNALEKIEREAYENGNILFRNWEDQLKNQ